MYFEELKLNQKVEIPSLEIKKEEMMDFAARYDSRPLHLDEEYAKGTAFHDLIAPGVFSFMIMWNKYLEQDFFGTQFLAGQSTKIEWVAPVYAGDALHGDVYISNLISRNEKNGLVELTFALYNQRNELVLKNVTECIVKKRMAMPSGNTKTA